MLKPVSSKDVSSLSSSFSDDAETPIEIGLELTWQLVIAFASTSVAGLLCRSVTCKMYYWFVDVVYYGMCPILVRLYESYMTRCHRHNQSKL